MSDSPLIAAIVVTYRRDRELGRLLDSLENATLRPALVVVVDHAASSSTQTLIAKFHLDTHYVASPENPGPGAGWKRGMEIALARLPGITHFLMLDDDVILPPDAVARLAAATANAVITCPMLLDEHDHVWGFPEPVDAAIRKKIRLVSTREDSVGELGCDPLAFIWCTGACLLVRRDAVDAVGFYRTDFWMLGEDLEYSMRLTAHGGGLFLPDLFVPHLPPPNQNAAAADRAHRKKFSSLLQNLAYLSFHHPSSAHLKFYLPGNARRFFRTFGWNWQSASTVAQCFWRGIVRGAPAGTVNR